MRKHIVKLPKKVQLELEELVRRGIHPVRVVRRANILLKTHEGLTDERIAEHVGCTARCVAEIRKRFCQGGLERALFDAPRSGGPPKFTAKQQQQIVALACTDPPEGHQRWTLELLCERAAAEGFVPSVSKSEVSLWLRENKLKPWRKKKVVCAQVDPGVSRADGRRAGALRASLRRQGACCGA
jgi:transposase